jgi:hypothetical protein
MKEEEKIRLDAVIGSWKKIDGIERLETTELEERRMELKKTLEEIVKRLQVGKYDDMKIAVFNDSVSKLAEENEKETKKRLEPSNLFKPNVSKNATFVVPKPQTKKDVPLLRVHNTIIHEGRVDRPVITYYRVIGAAGKLEESFKLAGNKQSYLGGGGYYEL